MVKQVREKQKMIKTLLKCNNKAALGWLFLFRGKT